MTAKGYCHFNSSGENTTFRIEVFDTELLLWQNPGSRDLGHGAVVWDSSVVFAKYMQQNPREYDRSKLAGKRLIELGSGCGLGGIAFMMKGAEVTFTDLEKVTTALTERNVRNAFTQLRMNQPQLAFAEPKVFPIDWTESISMKNHLEALVTQSERRSLASGTIGCSSSGIVSSSCCSSNSSSSSSSCSNSSSSSIDSRSGYTISKSSKDDEDGSSSSSTKNSGSELEGSSSTIEATTQAEEVREAAGSVEGSTEVEGAAAADSWQASLSPPYDIVLLTDCVFSPLLADDLVRTILLCCGPRSSVICCHEIRDEDANAAFLQRLETHFVYKRVSPAKLHRDYCNESVQIIIAKPIRLKKSKEQKTFD